MSHVSCRVPGCGKPALVKGEALCNAHYKRWRKHCDPTAPTPPRRRVPVEVRFWGKVDKGGQVPVHCPELGACWVWTASINNWGYGIFRVVHGSTMQRSHRVSWELAFGPISGGQHVLHRCDNPPCVRPDHLFLGSHQDNMEDRNVKGRQSRKGAPSGDANPLAKVSDSDVIEIRRRYFAGGVLQRELAEKYGITQTTVGRIVRGARRRHTFDGDHRRALRGRAPKRALTPEQEEAVKRRRRSGETLRAIAGDYGVSLSLISRTARNR